MYLNCRYYRHTKPGGWVEFHEGTEFLISRIQNSPLTYPRDHRGRERRRKPEGRLTYIELVCFLSAEASIQWFSAYPCHSLKLIREQSEKAGRSMDIVDNLGPWMKSLGFENVKVEIYKVSSVFHFALNPVTRLSSCS